MAAYFTRTGGSPVFAPVAAKIVTSNYAIQVTDFYVGCNASGITITLPLSSSLTPGQMYIVKDVSGTALTNNVIVNTPDSKTIDTNSSVNLSSNYMALTFLWNGISWSIV
jgi:hypothetical protein